MRCTRRGLVMFAGVLLVGCNGQIDSASGGSGTVAIAGAPLNQNCSIVVPSNPLSAQGLATPYKLLGKDGAPCTEANAAQAAFVQAAVLDPATGQVSVYNPLVVTLGTAPAAMPVVPTLPADAVVAIWFGFNGSTLPLVGADGPMTLTNANCVNGLPNDIFGQVSYCNAPAFFSAANQALATGKLTPAPQPLGTASDGLPCPTVRNFFNVDQDPSDNVTSLYLVTADGKLAQDTAANRALFPNATVLSNASDNTLLALKLDKVLGCSPYQAPDLANPGQLATAQPLNELSAAAFQQAPSALVPLGDPMVLTNGQFDLDKLNLYRAGVNQPPEPSLAQAQADNLAYCKDILQIQPARLKLDQAALSASSSPDPAAATNLFTFMAQRFNFTFGPNGLNCSGLLGVQSPIVTTFDANGVCTAATIN